MENKKNIIIVDDHVLIAKGLSKLIDSYPDYKVQQVFKNGLELVNYIEAGNPLPDLVMLDVKMPVMDGIATMEWIKDHKPELKVLVISVENDDDTIIKMVKNGAGGYLLKDVDPVNLKTALDIIIEQGYFYTEMVTNTLVHSLNKEKPKPDITFKENELKLLKLVCEEKTYAEIADEMFLSPKTIDTYRQNLFAKLNVKSRIGLVIYAIKHGIVSL